MDRVLDAKEANSLHGVVDIVILVCEMSLKQKFACILNAIRSRNVERTVTPAIVAYVGTVVIECGGRCWCWCRIGYGTHREECDGEEASELHCACLKAV